MQKKNLIISTLLTLAGCATQSPAPIEFKDLTTPAGKATVETVTSSDFHEKLQEPIMSNHLKNDDPPPPSGNLRDPHEEEVQIAKLEELKQENIKSIFYEVQPGEALETIAAKYQQTPQSIAELNNITPPYHLETNQIIEIKVSQQLLNKINKEEIEQVRLNDNPNFKEFIRPVNGKVTTRFGTINDQGKASKGINIAAPEESPVVAASDGVVEFAGMDNKNFGNIVMIHSKSKNLFFAYAHLKDLRVKKGDLVKKEQLIGHVGQTGNVKSPQLYLAVRKGIEAVDPLEYINY